MNNKQLLTLFFCLATLSLSAQRLDSVNATIANDTIQAVQKDSDQVLVVDTAIFDNTIATVDTESCTRDTTLAELPDSIYKARLQALPFVV